jgi:hypothetical protein
MDTEVVHHRYPDADRRRFICFCCNKTFEALVPPADQPPQTNRPRERRRMLAAAGCIHGFLQQVHLEAITGLRGLSAARVKDIPVLFCPAYGSSRAAQASLAFPAVQELRLPSDMNGRNFPRTCTGVNGAPPRLLDTHQPLT